MKYRLDKGCLAASLSLAFCLSLFCYANTFATSTDVTFTVNNNDTVLELSIPSSVDLRLTPTRGSAFNTANLNIGVGTNNPTGYTLSMTTGANADTLARTSSITDGNNNTYTPTIPSITGTISPANFESSNDTINKWGYKLSTESNYKAMASSTTITLKETSGPSNATGSEAVLNFAAKVDTTQPAGIYQTTLNFTAVTNALPVTVINYCETLSATYCMQNISTWASSVSSGTEVTAMDARDGKTYTVAKLADNNIWMTQNLDHDIVTDGTVTYDSTTTDIPSAWTPSTATYATGTTTWNGSYTAPESYNPGDFCWSGIPSYGNPVPCSQSDSHYHFGNFYNWTAAIAMNNSSSYTTGDDDVNQSICPAGWRLPIGGTTNTGSKSFQYLWDQYSSSFSEDTMMNSPLYLSYAGLWFGGSSYNVGSDGYYWSSVASSSNLAYGLYFGMLVNGVDPQGSGIRHYGISVRCVAR